MIVGSDGKRVFIEEGLQVRSSEHPSADRTPETPEPAGKMDAPRPHAKTRRPGRPKGTNYRQVDAHSMS
jgi:hypothetical protein